MKKCGVRSAECGGAWGLLLAAGLLAGVFGGPRSAVAAPQAPQLWGAWGAAPAAAPAMSPAKRLAGLEPLLEAFSGHVAVLPDPSGQDLSRSPAGRTLAAAGLTRHLHFLTRDELVDPGFFHPRAFPVALYLCGEAYLQTVREPGDGDAALRRYLAGGGTLLVIPSGPFPFYYSEAGKATGGAAKLGMNIGPGSFGAVPEGRTLEFRVREGQSVTASLPQAFPFPPPEEADQRWRPIAGTTAEGARYVPLVTLYDDTGRSYGEGIAAVEGAKGDLAGARILYAWCSILSSEDLRALVLHDALRYALAPLTPPPARMACLRTARPPAIDGRLEEADWQSEAPPGRLRPPGAKPGEPALPGSLRTCWDASHLYLAFEAETDQAAREGLRVWVDPDGTGKRMRGFSVGADGRGEAFAPDDGSAPDDPARMLRPYEGVRSVAHVDGRRWTAEVAIPFASLPAGANVPPRAGQAWSVQVARVRHEAGGATTVLGTWSATDDAGRRERFGTLTFTANPRFDDFEGYPEGADGTPAWTITGGKWRVEKGTFVGEDCGTDHTEADGAFRGDATWRDYVFSVRFKIESRGSDWRDGPWVGVRATREGDGYLLHFLDRGWQLHKVAFGAATGANCLASAPWEPDDRWHALRIEVRGNRLKGELDGKPLFDVKDDGHLRLPSLRAGGIRLAARKYSRAQGKTVVRFDDVSVETLR